MNANIFFTGALKGALNAGSMILNDYVLTVEETETGSKLVIRRGSEVQELPIQGGAPGEPGPQGVGIESIAPVVESSEPGFQNVYEITLTDGRKYTFSVFNGAAGKNGNPGAPGEPGFSPTINARETDTEIILTITDANGAQTVTISKVPSGGGGGITQETDPTVPEWAKQPEKPEYTAEEVGAASAESVARLKEEVENINVLPEGAAAYQQLVTDGDGQAKWEDRLAFKLNLSGTLCDDVSWSGRNKYNIEVGEWAKCADLVPNAVNVINAINGIEDAIIDFWDTGYVELIADGKAAYVHMRSAWSSWAPMYIMVFEADTSITWKNNEFIFAETGFYTTRGVEGGPYPVTYNATIIRRIDSELIPTTVPVIQSAAAGQTAVVKSVDGSGKPTEWEPRELPVVPSKVSAFENDAGYLTEHQDLGEYAKKSEIPDTSAFITRAVSDLENYYRKSELYTQQQIDLMISTIPKFSISVVSALPVSGISETTIYLLRDGSGENLYTEYIYVSGAWEILGTQKVDLTGYATETWVAGQLAGYQPKGDYALKSELPSVPTNVSAFTNDVGYLNKVPDEYVTEAELNAKGYLTQHQDISHKLDANKLPEAINTALAQAKASGEFDGEDGYTPRQGRGLLHRSGQSGDGCVCCN